MKQLISNPKAFFDYHIQSQYIAGIELKGCEVKSVKLGKANIKGCYVKPINNELFIIGMNISKYMGYGDELRDKKLLLNKKEIIKIISELEQRGNTIVPLSLVLNHNLVKVKIGVAKGKKLYDKREDLMKKAQELDAKRDLKEKIKF
jgi:SsrA-binding protein